MPLVLLSAPAGTGKTSLVADWVRRSGDLDRTAWVTFETPDEPFWPAVVGGLERLGGRRRLRVPGHAAGRPAGHAVARHGARAAPRARHPGGRRLRAGRPGDGGGRRLPAAAQRSSPAPGLRDPLRPGPAALPLPARGERRGAADRRAGVHRRRGLRAAGQERRDAGPVLRARAATPGPGGGRSGCASRPGSSRRARTPTRAWRRSPATAGTSRSTCSARSSNVAGAGGPRAPAEHERGGHAPAGADRGAGRPVRRTDPGPAHQGQRLRRAGARARRLLPLPPLLPRHAAGRARVRVAGADGGPPATRRRVVRPRGPARRGGAATTWPSGPGWTRRPRSWTSWPWASCCSAVRTGPLARSLADLPEELVNPAVCIVRAVLALAGGDRERFGEQVDLAEMLVAARAGAAPPGRLADHRGAAGGPGPAPRGSGCDARPGGAGRADHERPGEPVPRGAASRAGRPRPPEQGRRPGPARDGWPRPTTRSPRGASVGDPGGPGEPPAGVPRADGRALLLRGPG